MLYNTPTMHYPEKYFLLPKCDLKEHLEVTPPNEMPFPLP